MPEFGKAAMGFIGPLIDRLLRRTKIIGKQARHLSKRLPRTVRPRPTTGDKKLGNLLDGIYRRPKWNRTGDGSLSDAIRYERATGAKVGGKSHRQKGVDTARGLKAWLRKNPGHADRSMAVEELHRLQQALGQPLNPPK